MNKYDVVSVIGEGAYGIVIKCKNKINGELVAIKKFKENENDGSARRTILREVKILRALKHDNIVQLKEAFRRKGKLYLVFEYVNATMLNFLEKSQRGLEPGLVKVLMWQLIQATGFCHQHSVMHRDIKPENLLIDTETNQLKLCDFGFARPVDFKGNLSLGESERLTDYVATRWYRAPELLLGSANYGKEVDMWAIGCILAELIDGEPLFPGDTEYDQLRLIDALLGPLLPWQRQQMENSTRLKSKQPIGKTGKYAPQTLERRYGSKADPITIDLMRKLLDLNPRERPTWASALSHSFFESLWALNPTLRPPPASKPPVPAPAPPCRMSVISSSASWLADYVKDGAQNGGSPQCSPLQHLREKPPRVRDATPTPCLTNDPSLAGVIGSPFTTVVSGDEAPGSPASLDPWSPLLSSRKLSDLGNRRCQRLMRQKLLSQEPENCPANAKTVVCFQVPPEQRRGALTIPPLPAVISSEGPTKSSQPIAHRERTVPPAHQPAITPFKTDEYANESIPPRDALYDATTADSEVQRCGSYGMAATKFPSTHSELSTAAPSSVVSNCSGSEVSSRVSSASTTADGPRPNVTKWFTSKGSKTVDRLVGARNGDCVDKPRFQKSRLTRRHTIEAQGESDAPFEPFQSRAAFRDIEGEGGLNTDKAEYNKMASEGQLSFRARLAGHLPLLFGGRNNTTNDSHDFPSPRFFRYPFFSLKPTPPADAMPASVANPKEPDSKGVTWRLNPNASTGQPNTVAAASRFEGAITASRQGANNGDGNHVEGCNEGGITSRLEKASDELRRQQLRDGRANPPPADCDPVANRNQTPCCLADSVGRPSRGPQEDIHMHGPSPGSTQRANPAHRQDGNPNRRIDSLAGIRTPLRGPAALHRHTIGPASRHSMSHTQRSPPHGVSTGRTPSPLKRASSTKYSPNAATPLPIRTPTHRSRVAQGDSSSRRVACHNEGWAPQGRSSPLSVLTPSRANPGMTPTIHASFARDAEPGNTSAPKGIVLPHRRTLPWNSCQSVQRDNRRPSLRDPRTAVMKAPAVGSSWDTEALLRGSPSSSSTFSQQKQTPSTFGAQHTRLRSLSRATPQPRPKDGLTKREVVLGSCTPDPKRQRGDPPQTYHASHDTSSSALTTPSRSSTNRINQPTLPGAQRTPTQIPGNRTPRVQGLNSSTTKGMGPGLYRSPEKLGLLRDKTGRSGWELTSTPPNPLTRSCYAGRRMSDNDATRSIVTGRFSFGDRKTPDLLKSKSTIAPLAGKRVMRDTAYASPGKLLRGFSTKTSPAATMGAPPNDQKLRRARKRSGDPLANISPSYVAHDTLDDTCMNHQSTSGQRGSWLWSTAENGKGGNSSINQESQLDTPSTHRTLKKQKTGLSDGGLGMYTARDASGMTDVDNIV